MTEVIEKLSFKPAVASDGFTALTGAVKRGLSQRAIESSLSVKDFGAIGNGIANDTAAVQACFNAAVAASKAVFFPAGGYIVQPTAGPTTITGCAANPSGGIRLTVGSTAGYTTGDMVYIRSVGGVANANGSYRIIVVDGTHLDLVANNNAATPSFAGLYTRGGTVCKSAIQVNGASGIRVSGEGKANTVLYCQTPYCTAISFNGAYKCVFQDMAFVADKGIAFDLNDTGGTGVTTQGCSFYNVDFGGGASAWPDYCVALGFGQIMCSETAFYHCTVNIGSKAGLVWCNYNALSGMIFGGNFGGNQAYAQPTVTSASPCVVTRTSHQYAPGDGVKFTTEAEFMGGGGTGVLPTGLLPEATYYVTEDAFFISNYPSFHLSTSRALALAGTADVNTSSTGTTPFGISLQSGPGIKVVVGACPVIHGAAFQNFKGPDILIENGASDAYSISGCRSESMRFLDCQVSLSYYVSGCAMTSGYAGADGYAYFMQGSGDWVINGCTSAGGRHAVANAGGSVIMTGNTGFNDDALSVGHTGARPARPAFIQVTPKKTKTVTDAAYTLTSWDPAFKMLFSRGTAQTITIPTNVSSSIGASTMIEVQQIGAGKVTFAPAGGVTIHSRGGLLSLNGQWAVGWLRCDAADVWTLSGDIAV